MVSIYLLCSFVLIQQSQSQGAGYGMYVWKEGWDPSIPGCDDNAFLEWTDCQEIKCFTHTWNSTEKILWLLETCRKTGREISTLYVYGLHESLSQMDCNSYSTQYIRQFVQVNKLITPQLQIYGLLSDGGESVPEKHWVKYFVWYNENCASKISQKIDGIAVSNNDYNKQWSEQDTATYLTSLYDVVLEAQKQLLTGALRTHYSVSWLWGKYGDGNDKYVTWNGKRKYVMEHFIDIFDTIDVQVAFVTADAMVERLDTAGFNYSMQVGKPLMVNIYNNKAVPCQTTFFPFDGSDSTCPQWAYVYKTEAMMFQQVDLVQSLRPGVRIVIHHFRGAYSSGGNMGWPLYNGSQTLKDIFNSVILSNPNSFPLLLPYLAEQQSQGFQLHDKPTCLLQNIILSLAIWMTIYTNQ